MRDSRLSRCFGFTLLLSLAVVTPLEAGPPSGQTGPIASQTAPAIAVENWTKPQPGWLYVLDPKPKDGTGGRVWLIDPQSGKSMGSIRTGEAADFAISPDGSRLYVASLARQVSEPVAQPGKPNSEQESDQEDSQQGANEGANEDYATDSAPDASELAVIDTAQGTILKRGEVFSRALAGDLPPFSMMAVSGDGAVLRILIETSKSDDAESFMLATFDTHSGEFLPGVVHLGNCGPGRFISMPTSDRIDFLCPRTNRVRLIRVDADSKPIQNVDVVLPWERRIGAATVVEVPGSESAAIVRGDGAVAEMNLPTQQFSETAAQPDLPNRVPPAAWPTSPDGSKIFLGHNSEYVKSLDNRFYLDYGRPPNVRPNDSIVYQFRIVDTHTWRKVGTIRTKMPCWSAAISSDGKLLYAMSPEKHSILVIDTTTKHTIHTLKVDGTPALALVAS